MIEAVKNKSIISLKMLHHEFNNVFENGLSFFIVKDLKFLFSISILFDQLIYCCQLHSTEKRSPYFENDLNGDEFLFIE